MKRLAAALALVCIGAAPPPGATVNFVGCPLVRDTQEVPCWLAEHRGRLYFLGAQSDISSPFYPPQLGHRALVEGVATNRTLCGGIVLEQVKVSVLKASAPCQTILPAQGYRIAKGRHGTGANTEPPGPRPPAELPPPPRPYKPTTYILQFDFDREFIALHNAIQLQQAVALAKAARPAAIVVTGYRAATRLSDGRQMAEQTDVARRRAQQVADFLRDLGMPTENLKVAWVDGALPGDGVRDWEGRRVTVEITP